MKFLTPGAEEVLKQVQLLILDADGVLTDGSIIYNDDGRETKIFNVRDGFGLRLLSMAGIDVCIATGRMGGALRHRCKNLGIQLIFDGLHHKADILDKITEETNVVPSRMAFMGDDLLDLSLMARVALPVAVADAQEEVIQAAHAVTRLKGGQGAVRECCDAILKAQGKWDALVERIGIGA
ncbi:MAG: phenylphosphate carboxylase subunit delta [Deltaproteobacteria bacterium]|nr:MAG: phenylphosphate carboxylase subunit delta [Deltaproteobacteria bacterium]